MINKIRPYKHFIIYSAFIICALSILDILPDTTDILGIGEYAKYIYVGAAIVGLLVFNKFYETKEKQEFKLKSSPRRKQPQQTYATQQSKNLSKSESAIFDDFMKDK